MTDYSDEPGISEPATPHVDPEQSSLFGDELTTWYDVWQGMPEFEQEDLSPKKSVIVHFESLADLAAFAELVGQRITPNTQSIWYPEAEIGRFADKRYADQGQNVNPTYPVYIISKGRWEKRLTAKALDAIGVPYRIVVEPHETERYAAVLPRDRILELPFSNLGQGSIPARNWVWEHSISVGAERHWILDDNIRGFYRLHRNLKTPVASGTIFKAAETLVDRYANVAEAGFNYFMFAPRKERVPPLYLNTRIYSCILLRNDLPYRWRGRYNEDTDLSLRILKDGYPTILFNAFLAFKETTMTGVGGNTDELYAGDGRRLVAESLVEQHPDVARVSQKWGRIQHHVDYRPFRHNNLLRKPGLEIPTGPDNFGMVLQTLVDGRWIEPGAEPVPVSESQLRLFDAA